MCWTMGITALALSARHCAVQAFSPFTKGKRLNDSLLKPLIKKYNKSASQILMRWSLQMGFVPLPKSVKASRIEENADIYEFELDVEDMKVLDTGKYENSAWDLTATPLHQQAKAGGGQKHRSLGMSS